LEFIVPDANIQRGYLLFSGRKHPLAQVFLDKLALRPGDSGFHGCANGNYSAAFVGSLIGVRAFEFFRKANASNVQLRCA
jgi:hypothetical protein